MTGRDWLIGAVGALLCMIALGHAARDDERATQKAECVKWKH